MVSAEPSDEELLVRGDAEGFAVLYERCYPLIRGYLRRRLGERTGGSCMVPRR